MTQTTYSWMIKHSCRIFWHVSSDTDFAIAKVVRFCCSVVTVTIGVVVVRAVHQCTIHHGVAAPVTIPHAGRWCGNQTYTGAFFLDCFVSQQEYWAVWRPPDFSEKTQAEVVWAHHTIIWTGQDCPTGNSTRREMKRADRGNGGKSTSKSGLALNGTSFFGMLLKLRTAKSGGSLS